MTEYQKEFIRSRIDSVFRKDVLSNSLIMFYYFCVVGMFADFDRVFIFLQIIVALLLLLVSLDAHCSALDKDSCSILKSLNESELYNSLRTIKWRTINIKTLNILMLAILSSAILCITSIKILIFIWFGIMSCLLFAFVLSQYYNASQLNALLSNIDDFSDEWLYSLEKENCINWGSVIFGFIFVVISFLYAYWKGVLAFFENI